MNKENPGISTEQLSSEKAVAIAMRGNGYMQVGGNWMYIDASASAQKEAFKAQRVSFFGPGAFDAFYEGAATEIPLLQETLQQPAVINLVSKFKDEEPQLAKRLSYVLGGFSRELRSYPETDSEKAEAIKKQVAYTAHMSRFSEKESAEATLSAMAMYTLSGGPLENSKQFESTIFHMGEAVREDPVDIQETADLGVSQIARLKHFTHRTSRPWEKPEMPDIAAEQAVYERFPTIGAEFHLPLKRIEENPELLQRLAALNMSQYHRDSYIQMSRNDHGVLEVRMNPSIAPITVANWEHMRLLIPELNSAYFTLTANRREKGQDFSWENPEDVPLLNNLQTLGNLHYANEFKDEFTTRSAGDIPLGGIYLGQTERLGDNKYDFTGGWYGNKGRNGQLGIYAGYGKNLESLAHFTSMAVMKPDILNPVAQLAPQPLELRHAFAVSYPDVRSTLNLVQANILQDPDLEHAYNVGQRLCQKLRP